MTAAPPDNYEFGHPEFYLSPHQLQKCRGRRNMVQYVRANWQRVPDSLKPIAEDLSSELPKWLQPKPKPLYTRVETNFD